MPRAGKSLWMAACCLSRPSPKTLHAASRNSVIACCAHPPVALNSVRHSSFIGSAMPMLPHQSHAAMARRSASEPGMAVRIANCFLAPPLLVPPFMQPLNSQGLPEKTIRLIVPYSPGGTADMLARTISQTMAESLGQQIIIDNRPGAGGNIGADLVAKAAPDGYTLLMGTVATHAINPHLYPDLPYDAAQDSAPIILLATLPNLLVVNSSLAAKDVKDLIALAKSKPGELAFASAGNGTSQHLSGELFKKMTGVDMTHIPYKGSAPAVTDLIGGQVQLMFDNIPSSLPHVRAGKLRALAVSRARRPPPPSRPPAPPRT